MQSARYVARFTLSFAAASIIGTIAGINLGRFLDYMVIG